MHARDKGLFPPQSPLPPAKAISISQTDGATETTLGAIKTVLDSINARAALLNEEATQLLLLNTLESVLAAIQTLATEATLEVAVSELENIAEAAMKSNQNEDAELIALQQIRDRLYQIH